jgi:hypothetical protein
VPVFVDPYVYLKIKCLQEKRKEKKNNRLVGVLDAADGTGPVGGTVRGCDGRTCVGAVTATVADDGGGCGLDC